MSRIVVGVDGSDGGDAALRWALQEARVRGAVLQVLYAWSYLDQPAEDDGFRPDYSEADAAAALDTIVARVAGDTADVVVEKRVVNDLPARTLVDAAADADLLVVGSRGLGGLKRLVLGSVSQQCAQQAPCPVVIVPQR